MKYLVRADHATVVRVTAFLLVLVVCIQTEIRAQWYGPAIPDSIAFQGHLSKSGVPLDTTMDLTFIMRKNGTMVWSQVVTDVVVSNGVFDVMLSNSELDTVAFNRPIQLAVEIGGKEISPATPLTSATYALGVRGFYAVPVTATDAGNPDGWNVIAGAPHNYVAANTTGATIGGGGGESYAIAGPDSVVGHWGTVSGGYANTAGFLGSVTGGSSNRATGTASTVAGGAINTAIGDYSVVAGGSSNRAIGAHSFAAGYEARAIHEGSFVWSDPIDGAVFSSTAPEQFLIDATGGVGIGTNAPLGVLHVTTGSVGDAEVYIEADTDDSNENDNPGLTFLQDGRNAGLRMGFFESAYGSNVFGLATTWFGAQHPASIAIEAETGDVGIGFPGPANPTNQLHVVDQIDGGATIDGHVALIENIASTYVSGPDVLALKSSTPGASMSNLTNYITFFEGGGAAIGSIEGAGGPGISLNTSSADFAEYVPKKDAPEKFERGQVIGLDADGASLRTDGAHRILVVTKSPAVVGNRPLDGDDEAFVKAALVGQVDVYLDGPAHAGDYILASGQNDGKAIAKSPSSMRVDDLDRLIGRAWESKQFGSDQVHIEVGLDLTSVMKEIMRRQDKRIERLEEVVAELERRTTN